MSVLDFFKSAPKVVDNVFDKDKGLLTQVGQFIGHQQYTEQEKQNDQKTLVSSVQAFAVATLGENTERSKTRRKLAVGWFEMHWFMIRVNFLSVFVDHFAIKISEQVSYELSKELATYVFNPWLCGITGGIGLFFWGTHGLRSSKWAKAD